MNHGRQVDPVADFPGFAPGTAPTGLDSEIMVAAIDLLHRTGSTSFQVGWVDEVNPRVWYATVAYGARREAAAAIDPVTAVLRLAEQLIDGGTCNHCHRPSGLDLNIEVPMTSMPHPIKPISDQVCWYYFDRAETRFKRGCE